MGADSIYIQMEKILDQFNKEAQEVTDKAIQQVSKEAVNKLRNTSPKRKGKYARGWRAGKVDKKTVVVYNATASQLTHLLEFGHVVRNKYGTYGRAPAQPHIGPVEQWASDELPRQIMEGLE